MDKRLKKFLGRIRISRPAVLAIIFVLMSGILIHRLYTLQIVNGATYRDNFRLMTTKKRTLKASRGNIYDRNGEVLASNRLSYSVTLEDNGTYATSRQKALALNGEAYRISKILESHGDSLSNDFHIVLNEEGEYVFDVSGRALSRFKADVFGEAYIDDLTDEQMDATPDDMMETLIGEKNGFAVVRSTREYTPEELAEVGLPKELTKQDILNIIYVRYQLFTTSYRKYLPVTIATNVSPDSVADLMEHSTSLTGIDIVDDTVRVYDEPEAFASIIGYTGKVSAEDLSELQQENSSYNNNSIVGKSGIEKILELNLQGFDGEETVYVDNLGKVLKVDENSRIEPTAGNDVYLTIDKTLQVAAYKLLEQRIAGILETVIIDAKEFDTTEVTDTANIMIPIYDVYEALISNNILSLDHLTDPEASDNEIAMNTEFTIKQEEVFTALNNELTGAEPSAYRDLSNEMKEYESYIVNDLLTTKLDILNSTAIDRTDETYLAWTRDETITLRQYLTYAASKNWIDISAFATDETYLDSAEIYAKLSEYIEDYLSTDVDFSKKLYKYLIMQDRISGRTIMKVLYDQGTFTRDDGLYDAFIEGDLNTYDLVLAKIHNLTLTPAMLALDPCSGSAVITNPKTGEILACVTYPGYDNNRLANNMDVPYYNKLAADKSRPFYNKATQQTTAPGSTFKLVTTSAGLEERVISVETEFKCTGTFDLIETPLKCWFTQGHGTLNIIGGIQNSCNVFFSNVAYLMGINEEGTWSDSLSLGKIQTYAKMYNFDLNSGIEIPEAMPSVTDQYAVPSSIGQGTHSYTTTQLARYVTTLANKGTSYSISLIDQITDAAGNLIQDYSPRVQSKVSISTGTWNIIHEGMRSVIADKVEFAGFPIDVSGKTGTAQESKSRPSHALFIGYVPSDDPELAIAVRIGNGYSSTNAMLVARDIIQYRFELADSGSIITGHAMSDLISSAQTD